MTESEDMMATVVQLETRRHNLIYLLFSPNLSEHEKNQVQLLLAVTEGDLARATGRAKVSSTEESPSFATELSQLWPAR